MMPQECALDFVVLDKGMNQPEHRIVAVIIEETSSLPLIWNLFNQPVKCLCILALSCGNEVMFCIDAQQITSSINSEH